MIIDSPIISGSNAASGSFNQFGNINVTGSLTVSSSTFTANNNVILGTDSSNTVVVNSTIDSDIVPYEGGTRNLGSNSAQWNNVYSNAFTGSLFGTSSFALTASYATNAGAGAGFPFSGSAQITGSLLITELSGSGVRYLTTDNTGLIVAQTASAAIKTTQAVTSTAGQTSFNITNGYTTGLVDVFINGTKLSSAEFTDTSGTVITLATGSNSGDVVEFVKYFPASGVTNNALRQLTQFTATAGQTVFSASYTPGLLDIYYNGARLSTSDYTANNGTYFTLATGSADGDILDVLVYSYQVGAFNGIGGQGVTSQIAYFNTTSSITGSNNFTISGSTMTVTGSLTVSGSGTFTNIGPAVMSGSLNVSGAIVTNSTITAQTLVVQTVTSSVSVVTGSTQWGSLLTNTHVFSGSVTMNPGGLFVSSSGNVGIGTTTPNQILHVHGSGVGINITGGNNRIYFSGSRALEGDGTQLQVGEGHAKTFFQTTTAGTVMAITGSWVGIGTTSPSSRLDLGTGTGGTTLTIQDGHVKHITSGFIVGSQYFYGSNQYGQIAASSTGFNLNTYNGVDLTFGNGSYTPKFLFKSGGGTTYGNMICMDNSNDWVALSAGTDTGYAYGPYFQLVGKNRYGNNTAGWIDYAAGNASGNTSYGYHAFYTANTLRMAISWNGSIGTTSVGSTNIYNPSDIRLKRNIVEVPYGLNEILNLKPSKFNWREKFSAAEEDKDLLGFIAQEVQTVIPEAVESFGADVHVNVDEIEYTVENPLRVNEKFIIPVLVKAIQEQQATITSLQTRIEQLENK